MAPVRVRYQTIEFGEVDIHVRSLRDVQEYEDLDGVAERLGISSANWSLFGVVWDSSLVLAHHMADYRIAGARILEVGCGIGLASLVLNRRRADITATDYHPEAEAYLDANTLLNKDRDIPFVRTEWSDEETGLGMFDLIIGSDVLYEVHNLDALSVFIEQHSAVGGKVVIVDPGRGNHARFSKKMVALGYAHSQSQPEDTAYLTKAFRGRILEYSRV